MRSQFDSRRNYDQGMGNNVYQVCAVAGGRLDASVEDADWELPTTPSSPMDHLAQLLFFVTYCPNGSSKQIKFATVKCKIPILLSFDGFNALCGVSRIICGRPFWKMTA